jgi:hypothetical protein
MRAGRVVVVAISFLAFVGLWSRCQTREAPIGRWPVYLISLCVLILLVIGGHTKEVWHAAERHDVEHWWAEVRQQPQWRMVGSGKASTSAMACSFQLCTYNRSIARRMSTLVIEARIKFSVTTASRRQLRRYRTPARRSPGEQP